MNASCPICGASFEAEHTINLLLDIEDHIVQKSGGDEKHKIKEITIIINDEPWTITPGGAGDGQISQFR
jgi:hypothetical protein